MVKKISKGSLLGRSSSSSKDETGLYLVSIVVIVAVVALFLMFKGGTSEEVMVVDEEGNLVGEAFYPIDPSSFKISTSSSKESSTNSYSSKKGEEKPVPKSMVEILPFPEMKMGEEEVFLSWRCPDRSSFMESCPEVCGCFNQCQGQIGEVETFLDGWGAPSCNFGVSNPELCTLDNQGSAYISGDRIFITMVINIFTLLYSDTEHYTLRCESPFYRETLSRAGNRYLSDNHNVYDVNDLPVNPVIVDNRNEARSHFLTVAQVEGYERLYWVEEEGTGLLLINQGWT